MERKKVYVTRKIPGNAVEMLKEYFDVEVNEFDRPLTREELLHKVSDVDGVLCQLTDSIDEEVLEAADRAKVFANYAVGYNNIDVKAAKERGVVITNTPGVLTDTTADLAWALLFAASRRVIEADSFTREGKFKVWSPELFLGQDITGKTLGIIGAGRIGKAFAKKSIGFDMNILYYNRNRDEEFERKYGAVYAAKEELLKKSDIISIHVPLTEETRYLISDNEFKLMKNTAILINTARGPVVDEKALAKALKEKQIWSAGLDVYENEPHIEDELKELDNVVLLPHIGSASLETRTKMGEMAAKNIIAVLSGEKAINEVFGTSK